MGAQVLDRGVLHIPEGGDVVGRAGIPVERERMSLSVERAGVIEKVIVRGVCCSCHHDLLAEVHVLRQLDVEGGLSAVHPIAKRFPVFFRCNRNGLALVSGAALRPRRHRQHEGNQEEAEPLNNVCCLHC